MPTYTDSLLTWQHSMEITLDKYSDVCFSHQTADCTWLDRAANSFPVCNVMEAEKCLDVVLISKMVVEASLQKDRWENICGYGCIALDKLLFCLPKSTDFFLCLSKNTCSVGTD